jgi:hypothetical protein
LVPLPLPGMTDPPAAPTPANGSPVVPIPLPHYSNASFYGQPMPMQQTVTSQPVPSSHGHYPHTNLAYHPPPTAPSDYYYPTSSGPVFSSYPPPPVEGHATGEVWPPGVPAYPGSQYGAVLQPPAQLHGHAMYYNSHSHFQSHYHPPQQQEGSQRTMNPGSTPIQALPTAGGRNQKRGSKQQHPKAKSKANQKLLPPKLQHHPKKKTEDGNDGNEAESDNAKVVGSCICGTFRNQSSWEQHEGSKMSCTESDCLFRGCAMVMQMHAKQGHQLFRRKGVTLVGMEAEDITAYLADRRKAFPKLAPEGETTATAPATATATATATAVNVVTEPVTRTAVAPQGDGTALQGERGAAGKKGPHQPRSKAAVNAAARKSNLHIPLQTQLLSREILTDNYIVWQAIQVLREELGMQ